MKTLETSFRLTLITILEGGAPQPVCFPAASNLLSPTPPNDFNPVHTAAHPMQHREFSLRPRGWRASQFQHDMRSAFQSPQQATWQTFIPPPPMPLPPPIPPAASLPVTYYDTVNPYYNAPHYGAVHSPWIGNMDPYAPGPRQLQHGYYGTRFSAPPTQSNAYQLQDKSENDLCC